MNTKKLLFGAMAVSFFGMAAMSTVIDEDVLTQKTEVKKSSITYTD